MGAGSANCKVVARPPGRVCAQTPVAVKRVASLTCLDMAIERVGGEGWWAMGGWAKVMGGKLGCGLQGAKSWVGLRDRRVRGWSADEGVTCILW